MSAIRLEKQNNTGEVVNFPTKKDIKLKKDGTPKQTPCNIKKGDPHEVYPIKNKADVEKIKQYFINRKETATDLETKKIYARYTLMWVIGINLGLRASDLLKLKWGDIFYNDMTFRDGTRKEEQKTQKQKTFFFNQYARDAITSYIDEFKPNTDKDYYIFKSREGGYIQVKTACGALKLAAKECGIRVNVGTHTMRKTFGFHWYKGHLNDIDALIHLQRLFNHASPRVTLNYIGMDDEESEKYYNDMTW